MASDASGSHYLPSPTEVDYPHNASSASERQHHHHGGGSSAASRAAAHYRSASFALNSQPASVASSVGRQNPSQEAAPPRWHHGSHEFLYDDPRSPYYHRDWRSDNDLVESRGREPRSKPAHSASRISLNSTPIANSPSRPSTSGSAPGGSSDQQHGATTAAFLSGAQWFRSSPAAAAAASTATSAASPAANSVASSSARRRSRSRIPGIDEPDRHVRAVITALSSSSASSSSRRGRGWMGGTSPGSAHSSAAAEKRPLRLKAMAQRPVEGSGDYVVAGDESLRVLRLRRPTSSSSPADEKDTRPSPSRFASKSPPKPIAAGVGGWAVEDVVELWRGVPGTASGGMTGGFGHVVNDVDWGVGTMSNKIFAACASGNFMTFDVEKGRFDTEFSGGHARSMLAIKASKIPSHGRTILTAGADGFAKLWDTRQANRPAILSIRHPCPVTSLVFCPPELENTSAGDAYLLGLENGSVFRYDLRKGSRSVGRLTAAHGSKAVMDLAWKAGDGDAGLDEDGNMVGTYGWLASGGLDRTVKIWDMSSPEMSSRPYHVISAPHPVRRVAWRPSRPTEIAVVSIKEGMAQNQMPATTQPNARPESLTAAESLHDEDEESRLEIWDVRRGYIPKFVLGSAARFGSSGIIVDAAWQDGDGLVTCYSNGALVQHDLRKRFRPLDTMPRQAISWNAQGEVTLIVDRFLTGEIPFDDLKSELLDGSLDKMGVRRKAIQDQPFGPLQTSQSVQLPFDDPDVFRFLARNYNYGKGDHVDICEWNAAVAESAGKATHLSFWLLLRDLIKDQRAAAAQDEGKPSPDQLPYDRRPSDGSAKTFQALLPGPAKLLTPETRMASAPERRSSDSSDASDSSSVAIAPTAMQSPVASKHDNTDYFGGTTSPGALTLGPPAASFQHRFGVESNPITPTQVTTVARKNRKEDSSSEDENDKPAANRNGASKSMARLKERAVNSDGGSTTRPSPVLTAERQPLGANTRQDKKAVPFLNPWMEPMEFWLEYRLDGFRQAVLDLVDSGEVQVAAELIAVLQAAQIPILDDVAGRVYESYMDLLDRHRLLVVGAAFRRLVHMLKPLTYNETTIYSRCARCRRPTVPPDMPRTGTEWYCRSCKRSVSRCVVCQLPVNKLLVTCSACGHGGHQHCMRDIFIIPQASVGNEGGEGEADANRDQEDNDTDVGDNDPRATTTTTTTSRTTANDLDAEALQNMLGTRCPSGCGCRCRISIRVGPRKLRTSSGPAP